MLNGKTIVLGVSGGIAAYKTAEITRCLTKLGASVQVVMTTNAQRFITPLTLQALSGNPVLTDLFNLEYESQIGHIHVARAAHLVVVAPATADVIAKMASGVADDYLTTILLATTAPVLVCPAMNSKMYEHPATQRNLQILRDWGHHVLEPDSGSLACREEGTGRLPDPPVIVETAHRILTPPTLGGKRVLVSAGPTWEPFDPVRFISNPSTGKMGYALAAVAARRSAEVFLVSGPSSLCAPLGVQMIRVTTAHEMKEAIMPLVDRTDAIVMSAAVSDYRPAEAAPQKVKKASDDLTITLARNPDILALIGRKEGRPARQVLVGFAAETENLIANATEKLVQKDLDFIVANNLTQCGAGFGCDTNQVKLLFRDGRMTELPFMTKEDVAGCIWDQVEELLARKATHGPA